MTDVVKPELPNPGDRLADRYTIIQRVSLGGFGAVYRALQDNLGRDIALKVLLPDVVSNNADYIEQFRQEALLTSQLRHPNTITIFDYGQTDTGLLFLVMEWLDGKTLTEVLKNEGALSYDRCLNISQQILKSLSEAHERGMVHRDLKPSNLMLCMQYGEQDFVKVLDFGLVKNLSEETLSIRGKAVEAPHFTAKRRAPGTPHYMAPEQAMGKGTTTSADIYAFGLILYEMLVGKRAFDGTDKMEVLLKQVKQPIPPLPDELKDTFLGKVVMRCVEKDPLKRPQNATALLRDYSFNQETRGIEVNNADFEAQAKWQSLAEPRFASEVSSSTKEVFVGRKDELEEFRSIVEKGTTEGTGIALMVTGPTGIGKTTLVNKFADIFLDMTHGVRINTAFLPQNYLSFSAIRTALRKFLDVHSDDASDARNEIKRALARYNIGDEYLLSFMTSFIVGKYGQAGDEREQSVIRLEQFFDMLSREAPVMFSVENIHWADTDSLNLFWRLASAVVNKHRPVFLVTTYRQQKLADNRELQMLIERLNRLDHIYYREMQLAWLNKKDCAVIIENAVKMQRPMANQCMQLSKGNPLFLDLVLRYIIDEKHSLSAEDEQKLVIPNSIERISLKRIEQVVRKYKQPEYREILRRAALTGETFSLPAVEKLLRRDGQYGLLDFVSRAVETWRREGILRRQWDADMTFEFVHPHLVEYFNIDSPPELHLNVALTKEALCENGIVVDLEDVARHFRLGGDKKNALRYLESAANAALQNSNFLKARKLFEEMLPLIDAGESVERQKNIYHELGKLTFRLSEYGPSKDYFLKTAQLAQQSGDRQLEGLAYCGIAELDLAQNFLEEANANYNRVKMSLQEENIPLVFSKVLLGIGKLSKLKSDWQAALQCFQRAFDISSNISEFDLVADSLYELGSIYLTLGNSRQAHECFLEAQKNYKMMGNRADEAAVLLALATTYGIFMRPDDAISSNEAAIETYQKLGDQLGYAYALTKMGDIYIRQLFYDEARKFVLRSMPLFKEFNDAAGNALCQALLAKIELAHDQYDKAVTLGEQALIYFSKTDDFNKQVDLYTFLAKVYIYQGLLEKAQNYLYQAETLLDSHQSTAGQPELFCTYGLLCECRGDFAGAERYYKSAQDVAQSAAYLEYDYIARMNVIKVNVYFAPGRWYYEELYKIANDSRAYGLKIAQLQSLLLFTWFEGVYGEQRMWQTLINDLTLFTQTHHINVDGFLRQFEFEVDLLRYASTEVLTTLRRSAGWIRQYLKPSP